jgi:C4-dicarboxylate transporter DctM subunit
MGTNLFVGSSISDVPVTVLAKEILPFVFAMIVAAFVVAYVPWLSLALI